MALCVGFAAVASLAAQKISTTSTEIGGAVAETASKASELAAQTVQQLNETYDLAGKTEAAAEAAVVYADELKQQTRLGWSYCASCFHRKALCLIHVYTRRHHADIKLQMNWLAFRCEQCYRKNRQKRFRNRWCCS